MKAVGYGSQLTQKEESMTEIAQETLQVGWVYQTMHHIPYLVLEHSALLSPYQDEVNLLQVYAVIEISGGLGEKSFYLPNGMRLTEGKIYNDCFYHEAVDLILSSGKPWEPNDMVTK